MYSSAVFTGVDLFAPNFYLDRVVPINHSWRQKTGGMGYPTVKAASFCVPCFDIIPECDRQTDRQTDMPPIAYTPLAKLALPCAVIKIVSKSSRVNINRNKNNTH